MVEANRCATRGVPSVLPLSTIVTTVRNGKDSSRYRRRRVMLASRLGASL